MVALSRSVASRAFPYLAAMISVVLVWKFVVVLTQPSPAVLPSPELTAQTLYGLFSSGTIFRDIGASLGRVLTAWLLAACVAIPLGLLQGTRPRLARVVEPVVELFRPISPLAWIPMAILWFGIGEAGKVFIIFIATFFPILLNTVSGVKAVDPVLVRAGRVLGCNSDARLFWQVILPAAMPTILVGLRISFGIGWAAIIAAELVAANKGLGYLIANGMEILRSDQVLAGMVIIALLGILIDSGFRMLGHRLGHKE
ncbi:ABC transporter permease [Cupriavidus respiraculi]|uniref:ABC transporter permease n=1 Tax=Cupriavidus respiraculi TaxID=195930 RepID=UPI001C978AB9|nr:ABC transporter permease [Cupriavidus respiraculi]MBY4947789.1 ABC transporter permease [Cupriavidus respiraculi]